MAATIAGIDGISLDRHCAISARYFTSIRVAAETLRSRMVSTTVALPHIGGGVVALAVGSFQFSRCWDAIPQSAPLDGRVYLAAVAIVRGLVVAESYGGLRLTSALACWRSVAIHIAMPMCEYGRGTSRVIASDDSQLCADLRSSNAAHLAAAFCGRVEDRFCAGLRYHLVAVLGTNMLVAESWSTNRASAGALNWAGRNRGNSD